MITIIDPATLGAGTAIVLFVAILASLALGRRLGLRAIARHGGTGIPPHGSLEGAIFALLGLLIAFTFSGALSRFDERRAQAVAEANAIGTAWFRIDLLPVAAQPPVRDPFRAYVDARIATYKALPDVTAARAEAARASKLQSRIWAEAIAPLRLPETRPTAEMLVVPALNEMFDLATTRAAATMIHPPAIVFAMLLGLGIAAALLGGYQAAADGGLGWPHKFGFAAIVAITVYVIIEIEFPRLGLVRLDAIDQLLVNARAGMN
ncbi:MAG: DUF4239 domain-containing protein [Betaproteobacteria bacterium]